MAEPAFEDFKLELLAQITNGEMISASELTPGTSLLDGGVFDSLQMLEIHSWLETHGGVLLDDETVLELESLGDVYELWLATSNREHLGEV